MRTVVIGTGTEIGKTHLGVALLTAATRKGLSTCGLKPIESGAPPGADGEDAAALRAAGTLPWTSPAPYSFKDPVSPHLAARRESVRIEIPRARSWVDTHQATFLLVETAGALLSPLGEGLTNLDLALAMEADRYILVAVDRLGVLHDVTACLAVWSTRKEVLSATPPLSPLVVLQSPAIPDTSTGTNAAELEALGIASQVMTMPRGPATSPECQAAATAIVERLLLPHPR
ncbi:MAG: ATP-dependent dethiobiotin synthetase BioD [Polyangiaceae bacterium]